MKKILAIVIGIAFAFGSAGYVAAQTPAPKAEEKKAATTRWRRRSREDAEEG